MKTSVMEVHDMLSVLSVLGVEERIGKVPGVESVTVNYAAGSATVRYDETRLEIADIRSEVRQNGFESDDAPAASAGDHEGHTPPGAAPATSASPKTPPVASGTPGAASPGAAQQDKAVPPSTTPQSSTGAWAAVPTSAGPKSPPDAASPGDDQKPEPAPEKK